MIIHTLITSNRDFLNLTEEEINIVKKSVHDSS